MLQRLREVYSSPDRRKILGIAALISIAAAAPALAVGIGGLDLRGRSVPTTSLTKMADDLRAGVDERAPQAVAWEGRDIDGDGAPDIVNPTGHTPRDVDAYGSGRFGASRDGGERQHMGVDYVADAGQAVAAPISGFVTKIGFPYEGDSALRYVQIDNPALKLSARVFYVQPDVVVGQAVRLGAPIGVAQTLQARYPGGITDHVHLEIADGAGRKVDAATLILARRR